MAGDVRLAPPVPVGLSALDGRRFGLTVGTAFLALGGLLWWRGYAPAATVSALTGGVLALAGLAAPRRLHAVERWWRAFGVALSKVTTPIIMGIVYFAVVTPTGWLMRLVGRNPLIRAEREGSFWVTRPPSQRRRTDMDRQF